MGDQDNDSPLGQALRSLIDMGAKVSADGGFGQHIVTFAGGRVETVKIDRSYRFPNIPCSPTSRKRSDSGA